MLKRMSPIAAATLCGISLVLSSLAPARAAGQTVLQGQGNNTVAALVWVDGANGSTLDNQAAQPIQSQITDTTWTLQDDHSLVVTKGGQPLLSGSWASNQDMTFVPLRGRMGKAPVDGTVYRNPNDLTQGYAEIFINQDSSDGKSTRSLRLYMALTFGGSSGGGFGGTGGGGTGGGGIGGSGFGNF